MLLHWLRELGVALYLGRHGQVFKNPHRDLQHGVDLIYIGEHEEIPIAITHQGDPYFSKKRLKYQPGVVVLKALASGVGVHLVSERAIEANIFANSASSL